jgi:hypothetical protein
VIVREDSNILRILVLERRLNIISKNKRELRNLWLDRRQVLRKRVDPQCLQRAGDTSNEPLSALWTLHPP